MRTLILATATALLLLTACQVPNTVHQVRLTPDQNPQVSALAPEAAAPADLAAGESSVVGLDQDGAHQPEVNPVLIDIHVWGEQKPVPRPTAEERVAKVHLEARHYIRYDNDWATIKYLDAAKIDGPERVQTLRYVIINFGDKPFTGDLVVQGNPGPDLRWLGTTSVTKVEDQREVKEALGFLPLVGVLPMALMDNYAVLDDGLDYNVRMDNGKYCYVIRNLTLGHYQGVIIEYRAELSMPALTPTP